MKRFGLVATAGLLFSFNNSLWGVTVEQIQREVLVYVATETTIIIPPPSIAAAPSEVDINYLPLADTIANYPVEVIEKAEPNFNRADTIAYDAEGNEIKLLDLSRLYRLRLMPGSNVSALEQALDSIGGEVLFAEVNGIAELAAIEPNDNLFSSQWGLKNAGQAGGAANEDIKATEAWEIFQGSPNVKIGIIDDGVDLNHPEFLGRATGDDYVSGLICAIGGTEFRHGTHVAGIAAAGANNNSNRGVAGVDWNARIISKDIFHPPADNMGIYNKIKAAVDEGADVLNCSWEREYSDVIGSAFDYAYKMNRVSAAIMGNTGNDEVFYPAGYGHGIIAVGALQNNGSWAPYSTRGNHIDVSAPGGTVRDCESHTNADILSTAPRNTGEISDGSEASYRYNTGTSMAAPFVAGLASLLKGFKPNLYNDDIENIIKFSADDRADQFIPPLPIGWDSYTGYGRINAYRALNVLRSPNFLFQPSMSGANVQEYNVRRDLQWAFINTLGLARSGLASGTYIVDQYELRAQVTFPKPFYTTPSPWPNASIPWPTIWQRYRFAGWNGANPNTGQLYCSIVPGTLTSTGFVLQTFVYFVKAVYPSGERIDRWYPVSRSQAILAASVLGEPVFDAPVASVTYPELVYVCSADSGCRWRVKGVKLNFTDNNINEEGLVVERKDATNNTYQDVITLPPNATTYTDTSNLMGSQTYTYRIRCFSGGSAVYSNEVAIRTRPKPPTNIRAGVVNVLQCGGTLDSEGEPVASSGSITGDGGPPAESYPGGEEPNVPPGCEYVPTNKLIVSWNAPTNQNPAYPILRYRVDAFWRQNRTATCPCVGCVPVTQLWETLEQSSTTSAINTRDTLCVQRTDTVYYLYVKAFDTAGDSSLLWIKQTCPPDSQLVVQTARTYSGVTCVNPCCNLPAPRIGPSGGNLPKEFALQQNHPNPFNPSTTIRYALPQVAKVELRIFNILGQVVRKLVDEEKPAGFHQAIWDGRDETGRQVSTGIYLYQIKAGDFVETKKMQLIK